MSRISDKDWLLQFDPHSIEYPVRYRPGVTIDTPAAIEIMQNQARFTPAPPKNNSHPRNIMGALNADIAHLRTHLEKIYGTTSTND